MFGIHHLLCDHCNWLFTGFGLPGMTARRAKKNETNRGLFVVVTVFGIEPWIALRQCMGLAFNE